MISKQESSILKAVAIFSIIMSHFWGWICPCGEILEVIGGSFAQSGVFLFLFLSGYGIMHSYQEKGLGHFWFRRLSKIYIPFLMVSIPQLVLAVWKYRNNIGEMYITSTFLSAVGLYPNNLLDGTLWFIPFILMQYLWFYISFKVGKNSITQKTLVIALTFVGYCIFKMKFTWARDNDIYGLAFLLGAIYAEKEKGIKRIDKKKICCLGVLSMGVYIITLMGFHYAVPRFINGFFLAMLEILVIKLLKIYLKFGFLDKIGEYSYELYLTEGIFFGNTILYDLVGYNHWGLLLHLLVIGVLAMGIQWLTMATNKRLYRKG